MTQWAHSIAEFGARPETGPNLMGGPVFVWTRDGSRVLFANPAAGALVGAADFAALSRRQFLPGAPLRRMLEGLGRSLTEAGGLARLRFPADPQAQARICFCRPIRGSSQAGLLVIVQEAPERIATLAELAAFFSDGATKSAVLDEAGAAMAGELGEAAAAVDIAFEHDGRRLRLVISAIGASAAPIEPAYAAAESAIRESVRIAAEERLRQELQRLALETPEADAAAEPEVAKAAVPSARREQVVRRVLSKPPEVMLRRPPPRRSEAASPRRSVTAGRVPRELSRNPVRFLWQTDAADRFLFLSPGLAQVVGRNSEVVGERLQDAATRLHLDPTQKIAEALARRDTWSGLTAWWPVEGSNVRVPVELTALPIYGGDHSFQGYRGFGVLKPAEALMPAAFVARFGTADDPRGPAAEQLPPYEEAAATVPGNVVPIRADVDAAALHRLTEQERNAFEEIASALRSRVEADVEFRAPARAGTSAAEAQAAAAQPLQASVPPPAGAGVRQSDESPAAEPMLSHEPPSPPVEPRGRAVESRDPDIETRLREMTAILDTATDGVLILDGDGVIESASSSAEALFGRDEAELKGVNFGDLLTPESCAVALDYLAGLKGGGVASLLNEGREVQARAGDGAMPLFMTMGPISGPQGGRFCAVLRDITHWKRTEAELVTARRAAEAASSQKSDFLARVSHEIRTPLNAIIGFAEVMIEERFGAVQNERYREYLRDIRTSGEHVVSLINDLLDISKVEAGKLDLTFTAVPLNDVVRESIGLMQPQANRAHVVLRSSLSREVPGVVADQRTLRQVILNLLSNSVKFTSPGGQVIASTSLAESGEAILRVRDTGEGMSEDELARALEPFRQLTTASIGDRTGTGLGLPLTKALVEANRASFAIRSARGEGTVVTVTFSPTRVLSE